MLRGIKNKVLIISSPRTGSTPLLYNIQNYLKYKGIVAGAINEPVLDTAKFDTPYGLEHHRQIFTDYEFTKFINTQNFVIKLHAREYNLHFANLFAGVLPNVSIVRIHRRNMLHQCVSFYISLMTGMWINVGNNNEILKHSIIPIDRNQIIHTIQAVKNLNTECNNFNESLFLDVFYEDIVFKTGEIVKNLKVKNQEEIEEIFALFLSVYMPETT